MRRTVAVSVLAAVGSVPSVGASAAAVPGGWASVATSTFTTCAIRTDATLWCWGSNPSGQLGGGATGPAVSRPQQVGSRSDWAQVVVGGAHACALDTGGGAWCWGEGERGQLGTGSTADAFVPTQVTTAGGWTSLTAGIIQTCGIKLDGGLWCWGAGEDGRLGLGPIAPGTRNRSTPAQVQPGTTWSRADGGWSGTCGLRTDQSLWCWGANTAGMLGDRTTRTRTTPTQVAGGGAWSAVAMAAQSACGLRLDGALWCWGANYAGQLANGVRGDGHRAPRPVAGKQPADWAALTAGYNHLCGLRLNGSLWCWGEDSDGELGLRGTNGKTIPTQLSGGTSWARLGDSLGYLHTCALRTDSSLWCWGDNSYGQLGTGDTDARDRPEQVVTAA